MRKGVIIVFGFLLIIVSSLRERAIAFQTEFHGYLESRGVTRDTSGFQYGFMNDTENVQWIQEAQFDLWIRPEYVELPTVRFDKAFLRYRASYDAIYALRDKYDNIRHKSPDDFELGRDDLVFENDMREIFADFVAENHARSARANLRVGRQIVQWGEADGFNLMNIVNPNDNRNKMFFSNPEDLLTPLWMGRLDVSTPGAGLFEGFNLQVLTIPDNRPTQFAPLDGKYVAPYAFNFRGFSPLPVKEDVNDRPELGLRVGTAISGWNVFGYYFDGYQDNPAIDFTTARTKGAYTFRHPRTQTYGYSFNKFVDFGNFVFRGEGSLTKGASQMDLEPMLKRMPGAMGFTEHNYYQALFGVDKSISNPPIGTDSALTTAWQVYYAKIDDWDINPAYRRTAPKDFFRLTMLLTTDYIHGTLAPQIFVAYDSKAAWMTKAELKYSPDGHWYVSLSQISFWGNPDSNSAFSGMIKAASEVGLKVGWRW